MKCVVIHGSPRRGNTWNILQRVMEKLEEDLDIEFDIVELSKLKIPNCTGCFNCILKGEELCPHSSIMEEIIKKIDRADSFIITSPVYCMNVSGALKNFIDHLAFKYHRPTYFTKKALVIVTTAGAGHDFTAKYMRGFLKSIGVNSTKTLKIAYRGIDLKEKHIKEINKMTREFFALLKNDKLKSPSLESVCMYNFWKAYGITSEEGTADYEFWKWKAVKGDAYDKGIKIGGFSKGLGKATFFIVQRFLSKN